MSSWQQALSEDIRKGKPRRDSCPVVMNRNQEKNLKTGREDSDIPNWICVCSASNMGTYYRCEKCGKLRPDERANRLEMRSRDCEIGRGGGYFQRPSAEDRKRHDSDDEEYDDFGRKKRMGVTSAASGGPSPAAGGGSSRPPPAPVEQAVEASRSAAVLGPKEAAMSDKQKAALARLHQKGRRSRLSRSRSRSPRR
mmetsp:Transcript_139386/g.445780  ORF Transcript_139386/g.445780 Transcript_139386/m.445780 type:complete len:196 (-) Transcript_139386:195-782(-)